MSPLLLLLLTSSLLGDSDWYDEDDEVAPAPGYCCQTPGLPREPGLCPYNTSCVVADLDGSVTTSEDCLVTDDLKFENSFNRFRLSSHDSLLE